MKGEARRKTVLLSLLVVSAGAACLVAWVWMGSQREAARVAGGTLASARADMEAIGRMRMSPGRGVAQSLDTPGVSARIREAARSAGLAEPSSVEAGPAGRVGTSDYVETPVYLGFEGTTLKQLVTFLHELSRADSGARAKQIELTAPAGGAGQGGGEEVWQADVAVGYLTYSPRK